MAGEGLLFRDLAVVLVAVAATALLFHRLKQPAVLGYLLAGWIVGPFSPVPITITEVEGMRALGELGIVFLLFALGLEFSLRKLRRVGATAILAGALEIGAVLYLGYVLGRAFGWGQLESLFLGSIMSISSTTIIVKVLEGMGHKEDDWAQIAFGILIIEDILAVLLLTGLSSASATGNFQPELLGDLALKLGVFLGAAAVVGVMLAPRFVDFLSRLKAEEVTVVVSVGLAFGLALLASQLGFSAGLGAFVAGALMAESPRAHNIERRIQPLRDVFTAIFFVTVGALVDPAAIARHWGLVLAVTTGVILGKTLGVSTATFVAGVPPTKAWRVGMTMAQIGEFSFVIAALGVTLGVTRPELLPVAVAVSVITAFLTPYLIRASPRAVEWASDRAPAGLRTYAAAYRGWVGRIRRVDEASQEWRAVRSMSARAALHTTVLIAIFAVGLALVDEVASAIAVVPSPTLVLLYWIGVSVIAAPFALAWYHAVGHLIDNLARAAVPQRLRRATPTLAERLIRNTFAFLAVLLAGTLTLLVASPFVPPVFVVLVVLVGVGVSTIFLGRSIQRFHEQVEATVARVVEGERTPESREEALQLIGGAQAWGAGSREVLLPDVSGGAGRTLAELRLRALTGASVVSVRSASGEMVTSPQAEVRFVGGDRILLIGDEEALTRAEEILLGRDLGISGGATELAVLPDSPLLTGTLGAARIPELTGASVLVVRRHGEPLVAEDALRIEANDVLVVSGTEEQVRVLAERLRCREVRQS